MSMLNIGTTALLTSQTALGTTSHNISNVNTEGFSRQRIQQGTQTADTFGDFYIGSGVQVNDVERIFDDFKIPTSKRVNLRELVAKKNIHLLDIGTGTNLIYPILAACHFKWSCTASELDPKSLSHAGEIIKNNQALSAVVLRKQKNEQAILENIILPDDFFDVIVCNPPFFKSAADAQKQNQRKVRNLKIKETNPLNFGGLSNELWTTGGEEVFIKKMILESTQFKNQVHWFTSLLSKKEHLKSLLTVIKKTKPKDYKVVDLDLGNKSSRFIAWTFR